MKPSDVPLKMLCRAPTSFRSRRRIFLQHDAGEAVLSGAVVPQHVHEVLPPVVVMKERRIEPAAVQMNRVGPVAIDPFAGDEIVVKVAQRGARRAGSRACGRSA